MMKYALLAGAMMVAAPAIAQQAPTTPSTDQTAPAQSQPTSPSMTSDAAPADTAMPAQTSGTTATTDATAATQPASSADQVAQVVEADFPKYDGDGNGKLSATEFASWMGTLRASSDPAAKSDNTDMKAWSKTAFAQADVDKNKSISKGELTTFLSKGKG